MALPLRLGRVGGLPLGNVFLGERLLCSITKFPVTKNSFKVYLTLEEDPSTNAEFLFSGIPQDGAFEFELEVRSPSAHIISLSSSSSSSSSDDDERAWETVTFKFFVAAPLALRTKVSKLNEKDRVILFLEAQIQNLSSSVFFMDKIVLNAKNFMDIFTIDDYKNQSLKDFVSEDSKTISGVTSNIIGRLSISDGNKNSVDYLLPNLISNYDVNFGLQNCPKQISLSKSVERISHGTCNRLEEPTNTNDRFDDNKTCAVYDMEKISLKSKAIFQVVFVGIMSIQEYHNKSQIIVGHIDIFWRCSEGQHGRLQTGDISHRVIPPGGHPNIYHWAEIEKSDRDSSSLMLVLWVGNTNRSESAVVTLKHSGEPSSRYQPVGPFKTELIVPPNSVMETNVLVSHNQGLPESLISTGGAEDSGFILHNGNLDLPVVISS